MCARADRLTCRALSRCMTSPVEQVGDGSEPDMRVRAHVHALPGDELRRAHLVEEDERPDHLALAVGRARRTSKPPRSRARGMITSSIASHDCLSPRIGSSAGSQLIVQLPCDQGRQPTSITGRTAHQSSISLWKPGVSVRLGFSLWRPRACLWRHRGGPAWFHGRPFARSAPCRSSPSAPDRAARCGRP